MLTIPAPTWAQEQFGRCLLGDVRRTRRTVIVAAAVAQNPSASFPEIFENWSDLKAAYDLFDNPAVTLERLTAPHRQMTCARPPGRYLVLGDTTEVDFGSQRKIEGSGSTGKGSGQGFLLHSALLVEPATRELIGLAGQAVHYRKPLPKKQNASQRLKRERESQVWGKVIDQVGPAPEGATFVHVLDSAADNFEVYCHLRQQRAEWIVRLGRHNRDILTPKGQEMPVSQYVALLKPVGGYRLQVRTHNDGTREAKIEVGFGALRMPQPAHRSPYVKALNPEPIPMWLVVAREVRPPQDVEPLHWELYTSEPVNHFEDAQRVIDEYAPRELIEEWHKALKTGCAVCERQLQTAERLETMTGLLSVVAVRLIQLKSMAQSGSPVLASQVVPPLWLWVLALVSKIKHPQKLTVTEFYGQLAKLGGFLGRKRDGRPGWITIWRGWNKLNLMVRGAQAVRMALPRPP